jgi:hypothetical protein
MRQCLLSSSFEDIYVVLTKPFTRLDSVVTLIDACSTNPHAGEISSVCFGNKDLINVGDIYAVPIM